MKGTIELLKKALRKCAETHHASFEEWTEEQQIGIMSDSVPVTADIQSICRAICGNTRMVETGWGCTTIYLDQCEPLEQVNEMMLMMSLPYGTEL